MAACGSDPPSRAPTATLFRGAHVFDGERDLGVVDVLIEGDRIGAIGVGLQAPPGAAVVAAAGKTLLPGLIDAHVHITIADALEMELAFGVTTVLDMMGDPRLAASLREQVQRRTDYADYRSAGNPVVAPGGVGTQYRIRYETLSDPREVEAFVDRRIAEGSDYVKIVADDLSALGLGPRPTVAPDTLARAIARAHHHGKLALVHVLQIEDARRAIAAGADGLAHVFADAPADPALIALAREHGTFLIPTLTALHTMTGQKTGAALADDPELAPYLEAEDIRHLGRSMPVPAGSRLRIEHASASVLAFHAAGIPILLGTDSANPGMIYGASAHDELALLVGAGLTPSAALRAATAAPAAAFGLDDRGRIAVGRRADLLLVDGDPTTDIHATRRIAGIWRGGVGYDRARWRARVIADDSGRARRP